MRIRTTQACAYCRKKKIKCDGEKPECKHCRNTKIQCEYTSSKKRGPRKGYVQILEERLNQMEKKLMHPEIVVNDTSIDSISAVHDNIESPTQLYKSPRRTSGLPSMEIITHLTDIFFKYINSVFFFLHQPSFMKSVHDGTVSERLLYSIMALSSRFSKHPSVRASPFYLASQYYAQKAYSLIDGDSLEPCLENIPFWAIMSFLEYGRASGPKSWIYGSMAIRFCQELQYYKEDVLSAPIINQEGNVDYVAMSARRHLFWTCYYIDILSSAGTHRPQCIERTEIDARPPIIPEITAIQDSQVTLNVFHEPISDNSLLNITPYFVRIVGLFGEVNRRMNRINIRQTSINWPPISEFKSLNSLLCSWVDTLPDIYQFNQKNLEYHRKNAGDTYFNEWLSAHAFWCSSMVLLHRGSLAFSGLKQPNVSEELYERIQASVAICRTCVDSGMKVFTAIRDSCGFSTLPYLGYSSYIFASVLMTSTFSCSPELYKKSNEGLKMLCQLVDKLAPHWPVCERLAKTIYDLIAAHQSLYRISDDTRRCSFESTGVNDVALTHSCQTSVNSVTPPIRSPTSLSTSIPSPSALSPPTLFLSSIALSSTSGSFSQTPAHFSSAQENMIPPLSVSPNLLHSSNGIYEREDSTDYTILPSTTDLTVSEQLSSMTAFIKTLPTVSDSDNNTNNQINLNNFDILYDTGLFGQTTYESSLFASSDDPVPDMSYPSSITRGSLDSGYEPIFIGDYTAEEQLATPFESLEVPWNSLIM